MASTTPPTLLSLAHTLKFLPDVRIKVGGKSLFTSYEVLSKTNCFVDHSESDILGGDEMHMHVIEIPAYSYDVVHASMFWIMSDSIEFHVGELRSPGQVKLSHLPNSVDAFDVYRFAEDYGIPKLAGLALETMKENFQPTTIIGQLFGKYIGGYPLVKKAMLEYAKDFWCEIQMEPEYNLVLGDMMDMPCSVHETSILLGLLLPKGFSPPKSEPTIAQTLLPRTPIQLRSGLLSPTEPDSPSPPSTEFLFQEREAARTPETWNLVPEDLSLPTPPAIKIQPAKGGKCAKGEAKRRKAKPPMKDVPGKQRDLVLDGLQQMPEYVEDKHWYHGADDV